MKIENSTIKTVKHCINCQHETQCKPSFSPIPSLSALNENIKIYTCSVLTCSPVCTVHWAVSTAINMTMNIVQCPFHQLPFFDTFILRNRNGYGPSSIHSSHMYIQLYIVLVHRISIDTRTFSFSHY